MATVFMKWLETSPKDYDRGIELLTLGRLQHVKEIIVRDYVQAGARVLEIGCGTGTLTAMMAERGAAVTAVDASPRMLAEAQAKVSNGKAFQTPVVLKYMDATLIGERFPPASFDLIVSTLVFSELLPDEQHYVLEACTGLLAPGGKLLIADEVQPSRPLTRLFFHLVRWPLVLLTWLLTRTSTAALCDFETLLVQSGYGVRRVASYLGGSLVLFEIRPANEIQLEGELPATVVGRLEYHSTLRTLFLDLWTLIFRMMPRHPNVRPGLYAVGHPEADAPVLVTGNYYLTVRRLVEAIDGQVNAWVLVADSTGINVWCAAGGGHFTAEKIIAAVKSSHLDEIVNHHTLVLPQLSASGVDGWRVRKETGWGVHWGPVRANDIPAYLAAGHKKTDAMRQVAFPLKDRLVMATSALVMTELFVLVPTLIFWRQFLWPILALVAVLLYVYTVIQPWLPGRNGLHHSVSLTLITLVAFFTYTTLWNPLPVTQMFNWGVGLAALSVFITTQMPGMSPVMRSEEANMGWRAVVAMGLGLIYWVTPLVMGWR